MSYCSAHQFLEDSDISKGLIPKPNFGNAYLSINVPIQQAPEAFSYIKSESEKFQRFSPDVVDLYKDASLHFTLGAAVKLKDDPNVEKIKEIIEPKKEEILKIIEEEISKLRSLKVAAKFTKTTDQSIFVFGSFEEKAKTAIETFQNNIVEKVYKVLEGTGVEKYTGNKAFGRPINFARWNVEKLPEETKGFFEKYTKGFKEDIKAVGLVTKAVLTYSDQAWSNPKKDSIQEFTLGK